MEIFIFLMLIFWITLLITSVVTPPIIRCLGSTGIYLKKDEKKTLYGTEATEFNKIREGEKDSIKKKQVPRIGGLALLAVFFPIGAVIAAILQSPLLGVSVFCVTVASLLGLYDDLLDIGYIKRKKFSIRVRLTALSVLMAVYGWSFFELLPNAITILPVPLFADIEVGFWIIVLFPLWALFWQISSIIDGIDGLSGSIYLILFLGLGVLSILSGNMVVLILATLGVAILIPWIYMNSFPAMAYLTETGITLLGTLFSVSTFLLALNSTSGEHFTLTGIVEHNFGIWAGLIMGGVLIATWVSNIIQLGYRKKKGKKFFRIAPLHHHFEAYGIPGSAVVLYYMLTTIVLVLIALSLVLLV